MLDNLPVQIHKAIESNPPFRRTCKTLLLPSIDRKLRNLRPYATSREISSAI